MIIQIKDIKELNEGREAFMKLFHESAELLAVGQAKSTRYKELQKQMRLKTRELRLIEKRVGELKLKK